MYVMSADQDSFGPEGSKSRAKRFSAIGNWWFESVVRTNRFGVFARIPWSFMSLATVFSEQPYSRAFNSTTLRGLP
jgi:hypothetical protein